MATWPNIWVVTNGDNVLMTKEKIVEALRMAILRYDADGAANTAKRILEEGIDPVMALGCTDEGHEAGCRAVW